MKSFREKDKSKTLLTVQLPEHFPPQFNFSILICRKWEQELTKARKLNRKPRLRNALLRAFWKSCVVDGLLVLIFTLLKSIIPVFLAQLLVQFQQLPAIIDNATTVDNFERTTSTEELTTMMPAISRSSNNEGNMFEYILEYMMFIW